MWYVIITTRSLLWLIMSLVATLMMMEALVNPSWLIGKSRVVDIDVNETFAYIPSVGVYTVCSDPTRETGYRRVNCHTLALDGFATDSKIFPDVWKAATFFIALGNKLNKIPFCKISVILFC